MNDDLFVPYVLVQGETTVPNGVSIFAASGGQWNLIKIPQRILALAEQLAALPGVMHSYLEKYNGACPFFGMATGFRYVRLVDYYQFDMCGSLIGHVDKLFRRGIASVSFA
jgi:hypothetical protein